MFHVAMTIAGIFLSIDEMLTRIKHMVHCTAVNSPLGLKLLNEGTVTNNETELVAALEADIQIWSHW
jgi:hypothetical protein